MPFAKITDAFLLRYQGGEKSFGGGEITRNFMPFAKITDDFLLRYQGQNVCVIKSFLEHFIGALDKSLPTCLETQEAHSMKEGDTCSIRRPSEHHIPSVWRRGPQNSFTWIGSLRGTTNTQHRPQSLQNAIEVMKWRSSGQWV